jgi:hypothetical protein
MMKINLSHIKGLLNLFFWIALCSVCAATTICAMHVSFTIFSAIAVMRLGDIVFGDLLGMVIIFISGLVAAYFGIMSLFEAWKGAVHNE